MTAARLMLPVLVAGRVKLAATLAMRRRSGRSMILALRHAAELPCSFGVKISKVFMHKWLRFRLLDVV
jgi:hypothetical protein